jgi:2-succinyl-5-enolpyruvyl-6-hydroxy-3-cyclohexene-1-carboxylate synthase
MSNQGANEYCADLLINTLVLSGIKNFVISPGSRSTPLVLALAKLSKELVNITVHPDERGATFYALGISKISNFPVVMICTSGSALVNCYPAVLEAYYSKLPLIIISADRPPELQNCGANQTINQNGIFGNHVVWEGYIPPVENNITLRYVTTTTVEAIRKCKTGPVHLNVAYRKPLVASIKPNWLTEIKPLVYKFTKNINSLNLADNNINQAKNFFTKTERGFIVVGELPITYQIEDIYNLASVLKWPIICDVTANLKSSKYILKYGSLIFDSVVKGTSINCDGIIHIGKIPMSLGIQNLFNEVSEILQVNEIFDRQDLGGNISCFWESSVENLTNLCKKDNNDDWINAWKNFDNEISVELNKLDNNKFSELSVVKIILSNNKLPIYVSNSLPVRHLNYLGINCNYDNGLIFSHRGVSGIDGTIAQAAGVAAFSNNGITLIIGDLAFFYDVNSLELCLNKKVCIVILNNGGGGIFRQLPDIATKDCFNNFFLAPVKMKIANVAEAFSLSYYNPKDLKEFTEMYNLALFKETSTIIEVNTDSNETFLDFKLLSDVVKNLIK